MTKMVPKELQSTKIHAILLVSVMLFGALSLSLAISSLMNDVIIRSSGRIATATIAPIAYKSEIRGVYVHSLSMINPDWNLIAQTSANYGINLVVIEATGNNWAHYKSSVIPYESEELAPAIAACHARGIKLWASMNVMLSAYQADGQQRRVVLDDGSTANWLCPTKQASRDLVKAIVEEMATNYDIDGFMFDYARYDTDRMCYCEECHQKFIADTGLTDVAWRDDVVPGGRYNKEFMEWRIKPITELVRDIRSWMLAIKPNLEFSAAAWTIFQDAPTYWRYWIGQDTTDWIAKDYLDVVAPMAYTDSLTATEGYMLNDLKYMIGGSEGKIPLVAFVDTCVDAVSTPENFKQRVDKIRELGCDGWIIWRYGGPGDGEGSNAPDIRDYLSILDLPNVFSIDNIQVSAVETEATITWTTDLPATSKVEYSTSPLFNASFEYSSAVDFNYWDINHISGIIVENSTLVTTHSVILTDLLPGTKYYFRVQSQDESGMVVTSKVLTFTTGS
jgi:uncharacterized lipoprotein YddW (UPF0748 family)